MLHLLLGRQDFFSPFPKQQILDFSKLKEFADDNYEFDENGEKFSKGTEDAVGKGKLLVTSDFSFSHGVFKRLVLQTRKNQGLFGKGLRSASESNNIILKQWKSKKRNKKKIK